MAGALAELIDIFKQEFHSIDFDEVHVSLLEAMGSVLPMVPPDLQQHTIDVLRKKGVDVRLNTAVTEYDGNDLKLASGETIATKTVIWAAGVRAQDFIKDCGGEVDRAGRVVVEENVGDDGGHGLPALMEDDAHVLDAVEGLELLGDVGDAVLAGQAGEPEGGGAVDAVGGEVGHDIAPSCECVLAVPARLRT